MRVKENIEDLLQSDDDVTIWLKQAGYPAPTLADKTGPVTLLRSARRLRESVRSLVERRKIGRRGDTFVLNFFLAANRSYPQLIWRKSTVPTMETVRRQETVESILAPVAEAAASLLSTPNFELINTVKTTPARSGSSIRPSHIIGAGAAWKSVGIAAK
jgi:predicted RNA-binding Zn ribbon-like protein